MNVGDVVTNENYKRGYKVKRGPGWNYPDKQDKDSIYGVILNKREIPFTDDEEVLVLWIDKDNHGLRKYPYMVGRGNQFDLVFAEETIDYSLEDIFAALDELEQRFS